MFTIAGWVTGLLATAFILFSILLTLVILIQKPKGGGLAGAFGGAGGGQAAVFGAKTGDVLTYATILFFGIFLLLAIFLVYSTRADQQIQPAIVAPQETTDPGMLPGGTIPPSGTVPGVPATGVETNVLPPAPPVVPPAAPAPAPASPEGGVAPAPAPAPAPTPQP